MKVIYFELNDWEAGRYYPDKEPFTTWMNERNLYEYLLNNDWCKKNHLITISYFVDMSLSIFIAAPIDWVKENCPSLLDEDSGFILSEEQCHNGDPFMEYDVTKAGAYFPEVKYGVDGHPFLEYKTLILV